MPALTKELESRFDALKQRGRLPRKDSLAKSLKCSVEDANDLLNQWRAKHGERVRGEVVVKDQDKPKGRLERYLGKVVEYAPKVTDWAIDSGTILVAVVIDLVLSGICLYIMGPSALEKVAFVAIAFIVVLFGLRFLVRGYVKLWVLCAVLASFLDTSFVLVGIDYQTNLTAVDRELKALEKAEEDASSYLEELKKKQLEKGEGFKSQIETQQAVFNEASAKASAYRVQHEGKAMEAPTIKAYDIFLAIPKALVGHWFELGSELAMIIAMVMFGLIFYVLQATMYTTIVKK